MPVQSSQRPKEEKRPYIRKDPANQPGTDLASGSIERKSVRDIFKIRDEGKQSYTDPDYEVQPGESDGVIIQAEVRTFDDDGNCVSKPQILKFGDREWPRWLRNKGVTGYSINKVLHRPSNIEPFEVDPWKGPKPEGR